jgi:hypothetical protein
MNKDIIFFGETNFRGERKKFGIKLDDRRRHIYIIGKTGMGSIIRVSGVGLILNIVYVNYTVLLKEKQ